MDARQRREYLSTLPPGRAVKAGITADGLDFMSSDMIELAPEQAQALAGLLQGVEMPGSIHPARWRAMQTASMPESTVFACDMGAICDLLGWVPVMNVLRAVVR